VALTIGLVFLMHWLACINFYVERLVDTGPCVMTSSQISDSKSVEILYNTTKQCVTTQSASKGQACGYQFWNNMRRMYVGQNSTGKKMAYSGRYNCITTGQISTGLLYLDVMNECVKHTLGNNPWVSLVAMQHFLSILAVLFGVLFTGGLTGSITFVMTSAISASARFREKLEYYKSEMDQLELPEELQEEV